MKKVILPIILMVVTLCSCVAVEVSEKKPIDFRYTEARTEIVTDYKHKYSWLQGDFILVPDTHTETIPEKYEVLYLTTYSNGVSREEWEEIDRNTYISLNGGGE